MKRIKNHLSILLTVVMVAILFTNCFAVAAEESTQDADAYCREADQYYNNGDYEAAFENYQKAAELGSVDAWYMMGYCYAYGIAVQQDYTSALLWYQKAADAGDHRAINNTGALYHHGYVGGAPDYEKAIACFKKAAEMGNMYAMSNLAKYYRDGAGGLKQDYTTAFLWFQKSAELGYYKAQYYVAECYENGWGVTPDQGNPVVSESRREWICGCADQAW